jgi:hypothetical protein
MKLLFLFFLSAVAFADVNPPSGLPERRSYTRWINQVGAVESAFTAPIFDWYEEQLRTALPSAVNEDPEHLVISVDRPIAETIELEESGDIESGTTYGMEVYAILDAPIETALEALLFTWGKPIGKREGITYPFDTVFNYNKEVIRERWGANNYESESTKTGGGVAKDLRDSFTLLVRGDAQNGYIVLGNYLKPLGKTTTTSHISLAYFKPMADGRTEFRVSARQTGQSYKIFGIEFGRRNFGFNVSRLRQGENAFIDSVQELKTTGTIRENN